MRASDLQRGQNYLALLACIYAGSLVLAAVMASKIITIGRLVVPAGVFAYCFTFLIIGASFVISGLVPKKIIIECIDNTTFISQ